ncbi:hypothetical protein ACQJBY_042882 [Aegilops geniculata]
MRGSTPSSTEGRRRQHCAGAVVVAGQDEEKLQRPAAGWPRRKRAPMAMDDTEPSSSPALAASGAVKASSCGRRTTMARHRKPSPAMSCPALQHHVGGASSSMAMIVSRLKLESNSELQGSD